MSRRAARSDRRPPLGSGIRPALAALLATILASVGPGGVLAGAPGDAEATRPTPPPQLQEEPGGPADTSVGTVDPGRSGSTFVASEEGTSLSREELDALTAEVASELRCPVCRNQSVLESSAELSRKMQGVIRDRLAAGESPEEVKAYFVDRYGEWILLKPRARGINLLVYVLPALALLAGALLVWRLLRRWSRVPSGTETDTAGAADSEGEAPRLDPEEERELEAALEEGEGAPPTG